MRVKCTAMLLTVYLKSNEITFEVKRPQKLPALESREKKGRGSNSGTTLLLFASSLLIHYCSLMYYYYCVCLLLAGLVIQDQTSSNLNSLDTKVHHKDDQQTSKQEIGPYFGFGVSSATTKSISLFFTVGLLMMH